MKKLLQLSLLFVLLLATSFTTKAATYTYNPTLLTFSIELQANENLLITQSGINNVFTINTGTFTTGGTTAVGNNTASITVPIVDLTTSVTITKVANSGAITFSGTGALTSITVSIASTGSITSAATFNVNATNLSINSASSIGSTTNPIKGSIFNVGGTASAGDFCIENTGTNNLNTNSNTFSNTSGSIFLKSVGSLNILHQLQAVNNITLQTSGSTADIIITHGSIAGVLANNGIIKATSSRDLYFGISGLYGDSLGKGIDISAVRDINIQDYSYVQSDGSSGLKAIAGRDMRILDNSNFNGNTPTLTHIINAESLFIDNASTAANDSFIQINANNISLTNSGSINTTNVVALKPLTIGRTIDLGTATSTSLSLTNAQLKQIIASKLIIGDSNSGNVLISDVIDRNAITNIKVISGSNINFNPGTISSNGGTLELNALNIKPIVNATDAIASSTIITGGASFDINGTTIGTGASATYTQLKLVGSINITNATLAVSGTHTPVVGQSFTVIDNDGADAIVGTFIGLTEGAAIYNFLGSVFTATISYTSGSGNDVVLTIVCPTITAGTTTNPTTCGGVNGSIAFTSTNIPNGTYSLTYTGTGSPKNVTVTSNAFSLSGLNAGSYSNFSLSVAGCTPSDASTKTLSDPSLPTLTLGAGSIICAGTTSFTIPYTATTGLPTTYSISGPGMNAVVDAVLPPSPITINLTGPSSVGNYSYTMTVKNVAGCTSTIITPTLAVNALPAAPTAVDQSFCIVNNPTVASLVPAISATTIWYNAATGGTALVGTTTLTTGDYYVANLSGNCESNRTKVNVTITPVLVPTLGAYAICQNAVVLVGEGLVASNSTYTNTINDNIVAGPTFVRGSGSTRTTYTPSRPVFYKAYTIVSPISGDVTFETIFANLIPFDEDDTYLTLFQTSFNPANPATNFLRGDDDSGTGFLSSLTQTLVMGETYVIVVSSFGSNETGPFTLQASQNVFSNTPTVNWYTTASGGSPIFTGFLFNPVGVAGSGIADTATAATTTFYVSSSSNFDCRTAVTFTVNPSPVAGTAIGTQMVCANKQLANLSVSGFTDNVIKWQKATDAVFTTPIDIPNSNNAILTGAIAGTVSATTYFRAVISNGTCTAFSNVVAVTVTSTIYDNTGIWTNGIPNGNMAIVFDKDFNISSDLLGCSCQVNYGINVTISNNANLVLENNLDVQGTGTMTFDNNTSLLQKNSTIANTGNILYNRTTTPYEKFDYEYWSTPVSNPAMTMPVLNVPFANWRLTSAYKYSPENYNDDAPVDGYDDNGDQWTAITPTTVLVPAKGYAIMAPTASVVFAPTVTANVTFDGIPNNGNIGIPLILSPMNYPGGNYNLIGNPYPSAIDADNFINTNLANISGTLYFWTHVGDLSAANPGIFPANYNSDDYAIYNLLGGVGTRAALTAGATAIPNGKIASGQGFFVKATTATNLVFDNSMRILGNNNQFFRNSNVTVSATNSNNDDSIKDRLWLNLQNNLGAFSQQLLGYLPNSTLDFDKGYDGLYSKTSNYINFYSYLNNQDSDLYKIQSRGNFQDSDLVKLGYFSSVAGDFKISIDQVEGILNEESTNIYIQDNLTNTVHNLKNSDYNFTTAIGDFNDRFLLRYTNINLTNTNFELSNNDVIVYKNNQNINIVSTNTELKEVQIYDIRGRLIAENKSPRASEGGTRKVSFDNLNIAQQILIVKIKTIDNKIVSKKIVF